MRTRSVLRTHQILVFDSGKNGRIHKRVCIEEKALVFFNMLGQLGTVMGKNLYFLLNANSLNERICIERKI